MKEKLSFLEWSEPAEMGRCPHNPQQSTNEAAQEINCFIHLIHFTINFLWLHLLAFVEEMSWLVHTAAASFISIS